VTPALPEIRTLLLAEIDRLPDFHPLAGQRCHVYGYLIKQADGAIAVDTGIGSGNAFIEESYSPRLHSIAEALAAHGVDIGDVAAVVNSHLHFDHCGNNRVFVGVPTYVQRAEVEAARQPNYTVSNWFDFPGAALRLVDGELEIAPGIRLIPTPGHTPGHQSVLVEGQGERLLICAQAAYSAEEYRSGGEAQEASEGLEEEYLSSIRRLQSLQPSTVFFSHDADTA
jgi:glyoxylase-like metal-dependent hydrolase (beta-lactamase superfamily II)